MTKQKLGWLFSQEDINYEYGKKRKEEKMMYKRKTCQKMIF